MLAAASTDTAQGLGNISRAGEWSFNFSEQHLPLGGSLPTLNELQNSE